KVGPGDFPAIFLLYRPEQPARLIEVHVVWPAIERREALLAGSGAAAAVGDAVGTGTVPGHTNEKPTVVAKVGRPPILRVRHQGIEVLDHGIEVELLEFLSIVKLLVHRIGQAGVPVEDLQVELIRPPVRIHRVASPRVSAFSARYRAIGFGCRHVLVLPIFVQRLCSFVSCFCRCRRFSADLSPQTYLPRLPRGSHTSVVSALGASASRQVGTACREPQFPPNSAAVRTVRGWFYLREACPLRVFRCHVPVCSGRKGRGDEAPRCRHSARHRGGALPCAPPPPCKIDPESDGLWPTIREDACDVRRHRSRRCWDGSRKRAGPG